MVELAGFPLFSRWLPWSLSLDVCTYRGRRGTRDERESERDEGDQREGEKEGWWSYVRVGVLGKGEKGRDEKDQNVKVGPTGTPNKSKKQK